MKVLLTTLKNEVALKRVKNRLICSLLSSLKTLGACDPILLPPFNIGSEKGLDVKFYATDEVDEAEAGVELTARLSVEAFLALDSENPNWVSHVDAYDSYGGKPSPMRSTMKRNFPERTKEESAHDSFGIN